MNGTEIIHTSNHQEIYDCLDNGQKKEARRRKSMFGFADYLTLTPHQQARIKTFLPSYLVKGKLRLQTSGGSAPLDIGRQCRVAAALAVTIIKQNKSRALK